MKKILLAHYEPKERDKMRALLEEMGFEVEVATDGSAVLHRIDSIHPDIVILYTPLPKINAPEVVRRLRKEKKYSDLPVYVFSDIHKGKRFADELIKRFGATAFYEWPEGEKELKKTLDSYREKEKTEPEKMAEKTEAPPSKSEKKKKKVSLDDEIERKLAETLSGIKIAPAKKKKKKRAPTQKIEIEFPIEKEEAKKAVKKTSENEKPVEVPESEAPTVILQKEETHIEQSQQERVEKAQEESKIEEESKEVMFTAEDIFGDVLTELEKSLPIDEEPEMISPDQTVQLDREMIETLQIAQPQEKKEPEEEKKEGIQKDIEQKEEASSVEEELVEEFHQIIESTLAEQEKELLKSFEPEEKQEIPQEKAEEIKRDESPEEDIQEAVEEHEAEQEEKFEGVEEAEVPVPEEKEEKQKEAVKEPAESVEVQKEEEEVIIEKEPGEEEPPVEEELQETEKNEELQEEAQAETHEAETVLIERKTEFEQETEEAEVGDIHKEGIPFGPYLLLEKIATGGMAILFKAKKRGVEGFEKIVAIKRILPHLSDNNEFITMFIDEAKVVAQLTHPNIVQIFDLGRIGDDYYIAMEYVEGVNLRDLMKKAREEGIEFPVDVACVIAIRILRALDYAHRAKDSKGRPLHIVHRDVSPQNILISYDGNVKLTDFGVAKAAIKMHQTISGALKGKLLYMSPEQAAGKSVDGRADIFAVGITLFEMLSGRTLFYEKGDNEVTVLEKVRNARIPNIRDYRKDLPERLIQILEKALAKDVEERYQNAREMLADIEQFLVQNRYINSELVIVKFLSEIYPEKLGDKKAEIEGQIRALQSRMEKEHPKEDERKEEARETEEATKLMKRQEMIVEAKGTVPEEKPFTETDAKLHQTIYPDVEKYKDDVLYPALKKDEGVQKSRTLIFVGGAIVIIVVGIILGIVFRGGKSPSQQEPIKAQAVNQIAQTAPTQVKTPSEGIETGKEENAPSTQTNEASQEVTQPPSTRETSQTQPPPKLTQPPQEKPAKIVKKEQPGKEVETPRKVKETRPKEKPQMKQVPQKEEPPPPPVQEKPKPVEKTIPPAPEVKPQEQPAQTPEQEQTPQEQNVQEVPQEPQVGKTPPEIKPPETEQPPVEERQQPRKPEEVLPRPGELVSKPEIPPAVIKKAKPNIPFIAKRNKWKDVVIVQVLVDENGNPIDTKVLRGRYKPLNEAAQAAAKRSKFKPATHKGVKVKAWIAISFIFK